MMVASPEQLTVANVGLCDLTATSDYYCGATTGVNLSLQLCCALNIAAWQVEPDEGCPTCQRNKVELFLALLSILQDLFICMHNFKEIVL